MFETVKRLGKLNEKTAATITQQIALAINYLHNKNIVHRDLKPGKRIFFVVSINSYICAFQRLSFISLWLVVSGIRVLLNSDKHKMM